MKTKIFEYTKNDISLLNRDRMTKVFISLLLLAVAAWQGVTLAFEIINKTLDQFKIIACVFVFSTSFVYSLIGFAYSRKYRKIIKVINSTGQCTSSVPLLFNVKKRSFIKLYNVLNVIITLATVFVLIVSVVYGVLKFSFYKEISYYYPVLMNICLICLNSCMHLSTEIKIQEKLGQLNNL